MPRIFYLILIATLFVSAPPQKVYRGALSYANLEKVVKVRGWKGTKFFDILLATEKCDDLGKWADVEIENGPTLLGIIVDCESPAHRGQLAARGLAADCNLREWVHHQVEIRVR
jgi:hypothetical protein